MTRIAFLSTFPPEPLMSGFSMRIHGILDGVPAGYDLLRVYPKNDFQEKYPPHVSFAPGTVSRSEELLSPVPRIILDHGRSLQRDLVSSRVSGFEPDLIIASGIHVVPLLPRGRPFVYDAHNIEWHLAWRLFRFSSAPLPVRIHRLLTCMKLKRWEEGMVRNCRGLVACSTTDAEYFEKLRREEVPVVFNGVDSAYWRCGRDPVPGEILFSGDMGYYPNQEAVEHIAEDVLPLLREKGWKGRFMICGKNPSTRVRALEAPDVVVTGTVEDVRPFYRRACLLLAPMKIGSGTPLKVLTAMAAGLPVVTTGRIAVSLGLQDSGVLSEADTPEETAGAVMKLLENPEVAGRMSLAGIKEVENRYSWKVTGRKYWEEIGRLIEEFR